MTKKAFEFTRVTLLFILVSPVLIISVEFQISPLSSNTSHRDQELTRFVSEFQEPTEEAQFQDFQFIGDPESIGKAMGNTFSNTLRKSALNFWNKTHLLGYNRTYINNVVMGRLSTLNDIAPAYIEEIIGMADALGVPQEALLSYLLFDEISFQNQRESEPPQGCTSWVATGNATLTGHTLFHKNRDTSPESQILVSVASEGVYSYKALTSQDSPNRVSAGINEHGLAVGNNFVFTFDVNIFGISNLLANRRILEECRTVEEAYSKIEELSLSSGTIFFIADKEKAAIVEVKASAMTSFEDSVIVDSIGYRANSFEVLEGGGSSGTRHSDIRYEAAQTYLEERKGSLTLEDCFELSRHLNVPSTGVLPYDRPDGSIANYHTLFGATFEIPQEHTAYLSTMWTAIGNPCFSPYIPIHLGSAEVLESWSNGDLWNLVETLQDNNVGPQHAFTPRFLEIEQNFIQATRNLHEDIAILLLGGQTTDAVTQLEVFELNKSLFIEDYLESLENTRYWLDSFYYSNAILSKTNLSRVDAQISLQDGRTDGSVESIIITQNSDWRNVEFNATFELFEGTEIAFSILCAETNVELLQINASNFHSPLDLSEIPVSSIQLAANLTRLDSSESPVLIEWGLRGDLDKPPFDWLNYLYRNSYWILGSVALIGVIFICCRRVRKKRAANKMPE